MLLRRVVFEIKSDSFEIIILNLLKNYFPINFVESIRNTVGEV